MSPNCVLMFFHRHKYRADGVRYCTYVLSSRNNEDGSMNVAEDKNKTNVYVPQIHKRVSNCTGTHHDVLHTWRVYLPRAV